MKRSRLLVLVVSAACVLVYVLLVRRHYSTGGPDTRWPPPHLPASVEHFQYGIMFDAGSTGTRIHVFKFKMDGEDGPAVVRETFRAIQPGLSAYADHPEECTAGILELLDVAKARVPSSAWSATPLVLKATAGLRLLPVEKANNLLERARALFDTSPFLSQHNSVSIMDGPDEGISAWITINFLTGSLHHGHSATAGMLDLGGGSTQITFSPQDEKSVQTSPMDYIRSLTLFSISRTLYTHSYLGLGLMSARLAVLGGVNAPPLGGSTELVSPCLAADYSGSWEYADTVFTVSGHRAGEEPYEACLTKVKKVLSGKVNMAETAGVDFYASSYYYDRALDLGLIDKVEGGSILVSDYTGAAKKVCSEMSLSPSHNPFLCLDLVYMSVLLQELGFPPQKPLKLARTINQVETSWALGAIFQYMEVLQPTKN
ncbi:ectonucleoside triphosphate diphosphohydrolase 6 [Entelurus aequoreus]|uniref:ectonucleoside triphosphate diphosphohydrolase 6 n=1 Tax=Entelurus aequoreus TaxID=161455 RepID=UPI002B1D23D8|nr:ectonucleoside triphosphate diphosphohydrolase 6 [Entelurus aequoreus]XP_061915356.1 ectonucleoside triphosphate diphosphohydrolase 6 [Entelurus aequoreus]